MIDINEDRKQLDAWLSRDTDTHEMLMTQLIRLAIDGFKRCDEYCGSRDYLGDDGCFCVRAHFATQDHYHLYLELRKLASTLKAFDAIAYLKHKKEAGDGLN